MIDNNILGQKNEQNWDNLLRPDGFDKYVGQEPVKKSLKSILQAANKRNEPIDRILLYGQAGLGKTTLAHIIAKEAKGNLKITSGPAIEKTGDLAAILTNLGNGDILFIDEVHRLNKIIEEVLYSAMESRALNIVLGKGPSARTISIDLMPFTLVAATTRIDLLSGPLRSRFGATFRLDYYSLSDIEEIIQRSASILGVDIDKPATALLAGVSRFTPRTANRILKRARDIAEIRGENVINQACLKELFNILEIDNFGLEYQDRRILSILRDQFNGGPAGINAIASSLGEEKAAIESVYEPYLIKIGLLKRTPSGRMLTEKGINYLKTLG